MVLPGHGPAWSDGIDAAVILARSRDQLGQDLGGVAAHDLHRYRSWIRSNMEAF